jgi:anti-sigma regulatory factor (Ser/Thr protein kinase)
MGQKHVMTVAGQYEQIRQTCEFVCDGARTAGFDEAAVFHIELACDEACTNIVEHAYGQEIDGEISVSYEVQDDQFVITYHDQGRGFDPDSVPVPPTVQNTGSTEEAVHETLQVGGLGIHFMRELMDDVIFQSDPQQGNTLIMIKKLPDQQS